MAEEWLSYSDLGERLNVSPEAARQKAIRARWPRRTANDGRTQVLVDVEDVRAILPQRRPKDADDRPTPDQPPVEHLADARTIDALTNHLATLREMVTKAEALVTIERDRADSERQRADANGCRADVERDRANALSERVEALLIEQATEARRGVDLTKQVDELRAILDEMKRRPWWRRLVG